MTFFLALGIAGIVLVLLSLVVGDLLDGMLDALEADWISTAVIGGFVSAFGFGGAAADGAGLPWPLALVIGGAAGVAVGSFAWWLTGLVKDGPSDGTVSIADSVGQVGRVLTDIPNEGFGVVRVAEADATRAEGEAQAAATLAVGQAEAEAMDKRAEAFAHYNDAAVLQMLIEVLPQIAKEVAAPISAIDQLTILSSDGAGALPRQVTDNVTQTLQMLKTTTGLDLESLIHRSVERAASGMGAVAGPNGDTPAEAAGDATP
ncbi:MULTISPECIES: flotillin domain-containing protein [Nocardioides]|uniref:Flotillin domain-containing protein n=1 Tax=Nocardioides vastitatis TaxID=2568655 RepID=A0ABW0ZEG1_9ACTN|nr:flotillin domain-containing protein [Nocardioides sp.]